jgi:hypothetical protein
MGNPDDDRNAPYSNCTNAEILDCDTVLQDVTTEDNWIERT